MTDVLFHWLERIFQPMEHTFRPLEFNSILWNGENIGMKC